VYTTVEITGYVHCNFNCCTETEGLLKVTVLSRKWHKIQTVLLQATNTNG